MTRKKAPQAKRTTAGRPETAAKMDDTDSRRGGAPSPVRTPAFLAELPGGTKKPPPDSVS